MKLQDYKCTACSRLTKSVFSDAYWKGDKYIDDNERICWTCATERGFMRAKPS